jgi:hypothetical protein
MATVATLGRHGDTPLTERNNLALAGVAGWAGSQNRRGGPREKAAQKGGPDPAALALQSGKIRRGLGGFRRGGEDRFLVFLHNGKPGGEILRMIGARLVGDLKIGA